MSFFPSASSEAAPAFEDTHALSPPVSRRYCRRESDSRLSSPARDVARANQTGRSRVKTAKETRTRLATV